MTTIYERLREESLNKYYKRPSRCKSCGAVIYVPDGKGVSDVKSRKFCSDTCRKAGIVRHIDLSIFKNSEQRQAAQSILSKIPVKDIPEIIKDIETLIAVSKEEPKKIVFKSSRSNTIAEKFRNRSKVSSEISPFNKRTCSECGDDYDLASRRGKPGKITQCNNCADEPETKYRANPVPAGASEGRNLHQWDMQLVKGGEKHKEKTTVG